jgi:hypothetical protein
MCLKKDQTTKISSKGLSKRTNLDMLIPMNYVNVLSKQRNDYGRNIGFQYDKEHHAMVSYQQNRMGLSFGFFKRHVEPDARTTQPLWWI